MSSYKVIKRKTEVKGHRPDIEEREQWIKDFDDGMFNVENAPPELFGLVMHQKELLSYIRELEASLEQSEAIYLWETGLP